MPTTADSFARRLSRSLRHVHLLALVLSFAACTGEDGLADDQRGASAAPKEVAGEGDDENEAGESHTEDSSEGDSDEVDSTSDASAEDATDPLAHEERDGGESVPPGTPAVCKLPYEVGPCFAAMPVYAYDASKGACVPEIYGGCGGNGNRFSTRNKCEEACGVSEEGPTSCPSNTKRAEVCLACGLAGGCAETAVVCALKCDEPNDCKGGNEYPTSCVGGICQVYGCI